MSMVKYERKKLLEKFNPELWSERLSTYEYLQATTEALLNKYEDLENLDINGRCFEHGQDYCYTEIKEYLEQLKDYLEILISIGNYLKQLKNCINNGEY